MNDGNEKKTGSGILSIVGMLLLVVVLFAGVKLVFAGLDAAIPQDDPGASGDRSGQPPAQSQTAEEGAAPAFCPWCGEELNGSFQWGQFCPWCGEKVEQ